MQCNNTLYDINVIINSLDFGIKPGNDQLFHTNYSGTLKKIASDKTTIMIYSELQKKINKLPRNNEIETIFKQILRNGYSLFNLCNSWVQNLFKLLTYLYYNHKELINQDSIYFKYINCIDLNNFVINFGMFQHQIVLSTIKLNTYYSSDYDFKDFLIEVSNNKHLLTDVFVGIMQTVIKHSDSKITYRDNFDLKYIKSIKGINMYNIRSHTIFVYKDKKETVIFDDSYINAMIHGEDITGLQMMNNNYAKKILEKYNINNTNCKLTGLKKILSQDDYEQMIKIFKIKGCLNINVWKEFGDKLFINPDGKIGRVGKTKVSYNNCEIIDTQRFKTIKKLETTKLGNNIQTKLLLSMFDDKVGNTLNVEIQN